MRSTLVLGESMLVGWLEQRHTLAHETDSDTCFQGQLAGLVRNLAGKLLGGCNDHRFRSRIPLPFASRDRPSLFLQSFSMNTAHNRNEKCERLATAGGCNGQQVGILQSWVQRFR